MESVNIKELNEKIQKESAFVDLLSIEMGKVIVGQKQLVENLMIALLANGHILLEGMPGLAKTLAISTLSKAVNAKFNRIQFTPDLLPADVTGTLIYSQKNESFEIHKGPVFANFVLAEKSTVHRRRCSPHFWRRCRSVRSHSETRPMTCRNLFS